MADKKKFKDTDFGKVITEKLPDLAKVVGDVLPSNGVLGIVKNIITTNNAIPEGAKAELLKQADDFQLQYLEMESDNVKSAREREVSLRSTIGVWVQNISAAIIIVSFIAIMFAVTFMDTAIVNKELIYTLLGSLGTMVVTIFNYWYGGSSGSDKKTDSLLNIAERK